MAKKPDRRWKKTLEQVDSKADLTVEDVYRLGLEHDRENKKPKGSRVRRKTGASREDQA